MTTGCGLCRRHPGSKKRPWNVEPASAEALRPGPPARVAKASLRKMRPAAVRLEVAGCIAWAGWPDLPWPGAIRADAAGGCAAGGCADCCADSWGCRPGRSRNAGWARPGPPRPPTRFSGVGATTVRSFGPCPAGPRPAAAAGAGAPEGRASCCGATRCAGGAARGAVVTRGAAARGACGATRARRCGGRRRERQVPRAAQEPPAVQPPGAALVPDVRRAARRAALLSLKWPPCRRQGQEALRCVCLIAT